MNGSPPPLRLAAIRICSYRGFPNPTTVWLARHDGDGNVIGTGRNLLLFGENGSGKSSFGKAVRDFLDFRKTAKKFDDFKYRYTDPPRTDRAVTLVFDNPAVDPLAWNPTARDEAHNEFPDMARSCGWLDYRAVWRASEVQWGDSVDIFRPLVEEILPGCIRGSNETFGQSWARITEAADRKPIKYGRTWASVDKLKADIDQFNASLEAFLPALEKRANELLIAFVPWTSMRLSWKNGANYNSRSRGQKLTNGSIRLQMIDRTGDPLKTPSEFLNEARLTAIGLCLYLAGMSQSIPPRRADGTTYPRLLVLDDVLLSLDMAHRLPLLKLLKSADFTDWQLLLLTHDRAWYEIAKQQLEGWAHCELFAQRVGDYDQPMLREDQDHLSQAVDYLTAGDLKAAAVYVRTKFELVLKWACNELGLAVKYHPDPRKMRASDFWEAVNGARFDKIPPVQRRIDNNGNEHWWQPALDKTSVVPIDLKARITHSLSWVMNPLSHSESVDRYRLEIEDAIFAVNDLEQAVREAITMRRAGPVVLREMLISILDYRAKG